MAKPITDIPGAANQQLRSLKKNAQGSKFSSKLNDAKNKQLAEEIVSEVMSELQGSDDFTLQLQNKITDIILGRITYSKAETDITQADLDQIREEIVKSLGNSDALNDDIKQAASKCADLVVQNAGPSGNADETIKQIKELTEKAEEKNAEAGQPTPEAPVPDNSAKDQAEAQVSESIDDLKQELDAQFKQTTSITDRMTALMLSPIKIATASVTASLAMISSIVNAASKMISQTFKSMGKAISTAFKAVGDTYKAAKEAVKTVVLAPFKFIGNIFGKLNPFKKAAPKKKDPIEKQFFERVELIKKFIDKIDDFVVNFVKNNAKVLNKIFKKTLNTIIDQMVDSVIAKMKVVFSALAEGIGRIVGTVVSSVMTAVAAPIMPLIYVIAAIITGIGVAIAVILMKFPEYAKPIIEVIPIIIDIFGKIVEFVMTKLWNFFKEQLWPFFANEVWPFFRNKVWPFLTGSVFKIVEMAVNCFLNTIWPFLRDTVWPWVKEKLAMLIDFVIEKVWPLVRDVLTWIRDEIITPVWEKFVVPLLKWLVDNIIPFVDKYVLPVLGKILEILNLLLIAIKPWIKPIVNTILEILDWLLDLLYKIFVVLEPVVIAIAQVISTVLEVVFNAIDAIISPILRWLQKQLIKLKDLWNSFVETMAGFEFCGCRPFRFLAGCTFKTDQGPSGAPSPEKPDTDGKTGVSEFVQELVNGIVNATDIINDAIKALVYDQVKKKIKSIFKFLMNQQENEEAIDTEALNKKLSSDESLKILNIAIEKAENIIKQLQQVDRALVAIVNEICKNDADAEPAVEKSIKQTAETDGANDKAEEKKEGEDKKPAFDVNEFLDELFSDTESIQETNTEVADTIEQTAEAAKENAMTFLKDALMPLVQSFEEPLTETVKFLSQPPEENLQVSTINTGGNDNEPNQALSDQ